MKINVLLCNASRHAMIAQSERITQFLRKNTDVKNICADGIRLHCSRSSIIDQVCEICDTHSIPVQRIDNWNVRVAMKESGDGFGVYFA